MHSPKEYVFKLLIIARQHVAFSMLALAFIIFSGLIFFKSESEPAVIKETPRRVSTMLVKTSNLSPSLPLYVRVTTPNRARLRSSVTADVAGLDAFEGSEVKSNQVLVRLDNQETELEVQQRRAELADIEAQINSEKQRHENDLLALKNEEKLLDLAKKGESRARDLINQNLGSQASIDNALADVEQRTLAVRNRKYAIKEHDNRMARLLAQHARASALLRRAELDLSRTEIRSPFNGRVAKLHVAVGDRLRPGDTVVDVFDIESIELRGTLAGRYIETVKSALQQGHEVIANASIDGTEIQARLLRLAAEVSNASGGVDAFFGVTSGASALQLGRSLQLFLQLPPSQNAVAVPITALYGSEQLYKVVNARLKAVSVKRLGDYRSAGNQPEVLVHSPDLTDNDVIVVSQLPNAVENLLVDPVRQE
jgi:multidrug efflux pump subunit AcrA (membrane-fusion protein)